MKLLIAIDPAMPTGAWKLVQIPPPEPERYRWINHHADRPLPPPIEDHDHGDEHPRLRVFGLGYFESWWCRVCFMPNGMREQLLGKTRGRCCYYCNTERPEYPARSR